MSQALRGKQLRPADPAALPDAAALRAALDLDGGATARFVSGRSSVARTLDEWMHHDAQGWTQFDVELPDGAHAIVKWDPKLERFVEVPWNRPATRTDLRRRHPT